MRNNYIETDKIHYLNYHKWANYFTLVLVIFKMSLREAQHQLKN